MDRHQHDLEGSFPGAPLRVLIVDDCADTTASLAALFRIWGHQPVTVHDGKSALRTAAETWPDVVILDIGLPDMTGWEVAVRLREMPGGDELLLVVVSGYGQAEDRARSRAAGCDAHLLKPAEPQILRQILAGRQHVKVKT